jgi:hypothetical protein
MKIAYAILADAAQATPDGKISMLGGDFEVIYALRFPVIHPYLSLVIRLDVEREECGREHRVRVSVLGPLSRTVAPPQTVRFTPQYNPESPEGKVRTFLVINFQGLEFPTSGTYQFPLVVDDNVREAVKVHLVQRSLS